MEQSNAEVVAGMPAFDGAPEEVVQWLAEHVEQVRFESGQRLVTEGDHDRDAYLLVEGDVGVVKHGGFTDTEHGGGITGELALLYGHPRSATATALTPVTALRLRAADLDTLTREQPALARGAATAIIEYLRFRFGFQPPPGPWQPPT